MNKKNEKIKVTKIHDDEEVDSSYLYEGLKQKKEELLRKRTYNEMN